MSEILKRIKDDLKYAMKIEIEYRKKGVDEFLTAHPDVKDFYDKIICQKTVSRAIISMFPEIGKKSNDITDDDIIKLLKKYISQEKERTIYELSYLKEKDVKGKSASEVKKLVNDTIQACGDELTSYTIQIATKYLPAQANEEEIIEYIKSLDMTKFKNKMQAMGPIMKQFKGCDGNFVKAIVAKL